MSQNIKKIGFACKWSEVHPKKGVVSTEGLNTGGTTLAWLGRQTRTVAEQKLWDVLETNVTSIYNLVSRVATLEPELRMVRLTSDILTAYTHSDWKHFYKQADVRRKLEELFGKIGSVARENNVRLSFHPGQFTVLASDRPEVVESSIEEFEYHADMIRWMGYGKTFQDFKCNVHISGRQGPQGIIEVLPRLSPEARNTITIENDEMTWGLDASLELVDHLALVVDIHHHWVKTGEYIEAGDDRIKRVIDSWRGVRPVAHYSVSREDCLVNHDVNERPDLHSLLASGHKKQKLRAHSDYFWNNAVNDWALTHCDWADIMCESKAKNLASFALHETYKRKSNV